MFMCVSLIDVYLLRTGRPQNAHTLVQRECPIWPALPAAGSEKENRGPHTGAAGLPAYFFSPRAEPDEGPFHQSSFSSVGSVGA